jgi:hypothetical protein
MKTLRFLLPLFLLTVSLLVATSFAQKKDKKWTEWSKKETQKILDDSPWSQIQTDTDASQMFYSPTSDPRMSGVRETSTTGSRTAEGATNQSVNVTYHVRFFSARPVRQALARAIILANNPSPEAVAKLQNFADVKSESSIIVTVTYESNDQRKGNAVMQAFNSAITATLKNNVYLQRTDGKQLFLEEYVPPGKDGFGARFIFLRNPAEKPFVESNIGEIRFFAQFSDSIKIDRRFKLAEMMYQGELEY